MRPEDRNKDYYDVYERAARFEAMYPGVCIIDADHRIKRGDKVYRLQRADNPLSVVTGVACEPCARMCSWAAGRGQR